MTKISVKKIKDIHSKILAEHGGIEGLREENLLVSAAEAPYKGFGDEDFYPSTVAKGARLAFGLINNHPFADGNKRTAMQAMVQFLSANGVEIEYKQKQLVNLAEGIATKEIQYEDVHIWLEEHKSNKLQQLKLFEDYEIDCPEDQVTNS